MTNNEMYDEIENRILRCVDVLMYRNSPQDQLLAGGELLILLEICTGADYNLRRKLSESNMLCAKAFDFVTELRHCNCEVLIERNKTLPVKSKVGIE